MAKTEKRISINAFEQVVNERFGNYTEVEWYGINILVTPTLSFKTMMTFVNDVVGSCFDEGGEYRPEIMDFAIRTNILTKYANFRLPDDLSKRYDLVRRSDAVEAVMREINQEQLHEITRAIDRKLRQLSDANVQALNTKLTEVANGFEELQNQIADMFNGISNADIQGLLGAMSNGSIDEEKIVQAYTQNMHPVKAESGQ